MLFHNRSLLRNLSIKKTAYITRSQDYLRSHQTHITSTFELKLCIQTCVWVCLYMCVPDGSSICKNTEVQKERKRSTTIHTRSQIMYIYLRANLTGK